MIHEIRKSNIIFFLVAMLLLICSCNEKKEKKLLPKGVTDTKQKNFDFLCSLSKNLQNGDTIMINFLTRGSTLRHIIKASLKKNIDSIFLEVNARESQGENIIDFGVVEYGIKSYSDSLSFEHLFFRILNDSSISFEKKPKCIRILTILSNRGDKISVYMDEKSLLKDYINDYFIKLIQFYYPENSMFPRIIIISNKQ